NGQYFVTFRLADSLPQSVLESYQFERQNILATAAQMNRCLSVVEELHLAELFEERIEHYLDQGVGACHLRHPLVAEMVFDAISYFHGERYRLFTWCLMPNHVHVVLRPMEPHDLAGVVHSWKSFTAHQANLILGRKGGFWMPEYYDHLIRDARNFCQTCRYVLNNPKKAGLRNWRWVGSLVDGR
ncbi:MAG: transposase, partial [Phycisphaerae bacterium]